LAADELVTRYLLPISAPLLYMVGILIHARTRAAKETAPASAQAESSAAAVARSQSRKAVIAGVGARLFRRTSQ
jgi:hypothetical protein